LHGVRARSPPTLRGKVLYVRGRRTFLPHFCPQQRDVALEVAEHLFEVHRPRLSGARDIPVAALRIECDERGECDRKVLWHFECLGEERKKLFALVSGHVSEKSGQTAKCSQLQAFSGRQQNAAQVRAPDDSRDPVACPGRTDSRAEIVELADGFRASLRLVHVCPHVRHSGAHIGELRPRAVALAKPLGEVDQDVGGVLVASWSRKFLHGFAEEARTDDILEALDIEVDEARRELFQWGAGRGHMDVNRIE